VYVFGNLTTEEGFTIVRWDQYPVQLVDHDISDRYFAGGVQASRVMTA